MLVKVLVGMTRLLIVQPSFLLVVCLPFVSGIIIVAWSVGWAANEADKLLVVGPVLGSHYWILDGLLTYSEWFVKERLLEDSDSDVRAALITVRVYAFVYGLTVLVLYSVALVQMHSDALSELVDNVGCIFSLVLLAHATMLAAAILWIFVQISAILLDSVVGWTGFTSLTETTSRWRRALHVPTLEYFNDPDVPIRLH